MPLPASAVTLYGMVTSGESISSVAVYDGATKLGTTTINSDGSWSFTTGALTNGVHAFTATSTNASGTSGASAADDITIGSAAAPVGPTISSIVESPSSGDLNAGKTVTLTLDMSSVVTVNTTGGTPTLTLNDGGIATYIGRHRHQRADLQLHGRGRPEHRGAWRRRHSISTAQPSRMALATPPICH